MNKIRLVSRWTPLHCFLLLAALLIWPTVRCQAHEDHNTHATLTIGSLLFLDQAAREDGLFFNEEARGNIRIGSVDEDHCPNYLSHFYDPKTHQNTMPDISLPYCLKPDGWVKQIAPDRAAVFWHQAVTEYRTNKSAAFLDLGHVMHLLQDMTSPAHVHNDVHADGAGNCNSDGDDFERWGWCIQAADGNQPAFNFTNIYRYVRFTTPIDSEILSPLAIGLTRIFGDRPQFTIPVSGKNSGYAFVAGLADKVYDFTTFDVILTDTLNPNDSGGGELKSMFSSLEETTVPAAWWIANIGYSQGQCSGVASTFNQAWWMMSCSQEQYCGPWYAPKSVYCVVGKAYIENTGGGTGAQQGVPDTLIPAVYDRDWFKKRYDPINKSSKVNTGNHSMLNIYGDILYPAAVAYGAGLIQKFLDEAIMPKPITSPASQLTGASAQLNGRVFPQGAAAFAWFEWGADPSLGTPTAMQPIDTGISATNVSTAITGLTPGQLYFYRTVSSNSVGIRYGPNQTFRTPALLVFGTNTPNAWQITDHSTGSSLNYTTNLTTSDQQAAAANGWRYTITSRMADDLGGTKTMTFLYQSSANRRFLVWWDLDSDGNLTAEIEGQSVRVVATNASATLYHTNEIRYTNGTATYLFDGTVIGTWTGAAVSLLPAGQVYWGSGSSSGMGQMNFRDVDFQITGLGTVASYHAGLAGNPPVAPNPVAQGWTANPAAPAPPNAFSPVSPDSDPYLPLAETLAANDLGIDAAQLNGRADPRGSFALGWFEWGTSADYGNTTLPRAMGNGLGWQDVGEYLSALSLETTYHFRFAASNAFALAFGADQTFDTPEPIIQQPADTGACVGGTATFSAVAGSPLVTYQWQRNRVGSPDFLDISGATDASYTTPPLTADDNGAAFRVVIGGTAASVPSTEAFLSVISVGTATVTYDFNGGLPANTAIYGNAFITPGTGVLELNSNTINQRGAFLTTDLAPGQLVRGFAATFKARVQAGTSPPADGFSFNWATDLPNVSYLNAEEGQGSGLRVCFDTYDNGEGEAPAIDVWWGTNLVARKNVPVAFLVRGSGFFDVQIRLGADGLLDVTYGCVAIFSRLPVDDYTPQMGARFGLGSRTGNFRETHGIMDLALELYIDNSDMARITSIELQRSRDGVIKGTGSPDRNYSLQSSTNLATWAWYANVIPDAGGLWQFPEPFVQFSRFYRLGAAPQFPSGLVTWYRADGDYSDSFGPNDGLSEGALGFAAGFRGQAFRFNGTESMLVAGNPIPPPWTAAFWVNRQDSPDASATLLSDNLTALKLEQIGTPRRVGFTQFGVADYSFSYTAPANGWVHLTFVGTSSNTLLYVDAAQAGSNTNSVSMPMQYLGRRNTGADHLKALLDEITIFNRALTAGEIQQLRNITRGP